MKAAHRHLSKSDGFTLVELSIVMIVIGLLIGGVLKGQELIWNARLAATATQIKSFQTAYNTFWDIYKVRPGDIRNASSVIPGCTIAAACRNGDGNGNLGINVNDFPWFGIEAGIDTENTQFWKHLALLDLVDKVKPSAATVGFGETHPPNNIGGGYHARTGNGVPYNYPTMVGTVIVLRVDPQGQWLCGQASNNPDACLTSPLQAFRLDKKMDDGQANNGIMGAISAAYRTGCGLPNLGINGGNGYAEQISRNSCDVLFKLGP